MRVSMSFGPGEPVPRPPTALGATNAAPGGLSPEQAAATELRLLEAQLERMRGMLFGHSSLFFSTIRNWAFLSIGNPLGFMGGMTIGYAAGAGLLWLAGLLSTNAYIESQGASLFDGSIVGLVVPIAVAWTALIAAYLAWSFLRRPDEERFLAVLRDAYRLPAPAGPDAPTPTSREPASPAPTPGAPAGAPAGVTAPDAPAPTEETPR